MKIQKFKIVFFIALLALCGAGARAADAVARLTGLKGDVDVSQGATFAPATLNMELNSGAIVRTGGNGMAVLLFSDGTTMKLNINTQFKINDIGAGDAGVLDEGELWSLIKPQDEPIKVNTPAAVVAVRGTEILLTADKNKSTLTVVEGKVDFSNGQGGVYVTDSQESTAAAGGAPSVPTIVDYRARLKWTAEIQSVGLLFEHPLFEGGAGDLQQRYAGLESKYRANTGDADTGAAIGAALADLGRTSEALDHLKKIVDANPQHATASRYYAYVLLETGELDQAEKYFNDAIGINASDADAMLGLGLILIRKNELDKAREQLDMALAADEKFQLARVALAVISMRGGDAGAALDFLKKATADVKTAPYQAWTYLALLHLGANRANDAFDAANHAVAAAPNSPQALATLARVLFFKGDYGEARRRAQAALALRPYAAFPHSVMADLYLIEHKMDKAMGEAFTAAALDENNAFVYTSLAKAQIANASYGGALRSYEKALDLSPGFIQARTDYALLLARLNLFDEAKAQADVILEQNPGYAPGYATLGDVAFETGHTAQAIDAYRKSIELDPNNAGAHAALSRAYIRKGQLQQALESARAAIRLEPMNPSHYVDLGFIHDQTFSADTAALNYRRALSLDAEDPYAHVYIARQLLDSGTFDNLKRGWGEFNRSVLYDPGTMYHESRRGHFTLDLATGNNKWRLSNLDWAFQEDDTKLTYLFHSYQAQNDGARTNSGLYVNANDFWMAYQQDWRHSYALKLSTYRQVLGVPGSKLARGDDGDPDDYSTYNRSDLELSHQYRISPKNVLRFRIQLPAPSSDSSEFYSYNYNGSPNDIYQLLYVGNVTQRFDMKFVHTEFNHEFKWNKRNVFNYGFARYEDRLDQTSFPWREVPNSNPPTAVQITTTGVQRQNTFVAYAMDTYDITDRVQLRGMVRRDSSNSDGKQTGYRAILTWKIGKRTHLHAMALQHLGIYYAPYYMPLEYWSLADRHSYSIRAARSIWYEGDIEHVFPDSSFLKLGMFSITNREYVLFSPDDYLFRTRQHGFRASYERSLGARTSVMLDYRYRPKKYRDPSYLMDKNFVPNDPEKSASLFLTHLRENGLGFAGGCFYFSDYFADAQNYIKHSGATYCDTRVFYDRNDRLRYYFTVLNIGDRDYEITAGYPEIGRTWIFGIEQYY